ncbi:hypothetical protein EP7_001351 [Isosphaeraceae bacterium EP7]
MVTTFLMAAVLGLLSPADSDPDALVARLGSARFRDREDAAAAIERLGKSALTALRLARDDPDAEIRSRVLALYEKIESAQLTQATEIRLDGKQPTIEAILKDWNEREGLNIHVSAGSDPTWARRPLRIESAEPLTFWKALDRVCEAGKAKSTANFQPAAGRREPSMIVLDGDGSFRPPGLVSDQGPFRVMLTGLTFRRDVSFGHAGGSMTPPGGLRLQDVGGVAGVTIREQCQATLQVIAEPRMSMLQAGAAKLIEATDDKGQSWKPGDVKLPVMQMPNVFGTTLTPMIQLQIPMTRPKSPGVRMKKLRGSVPVMLSTRKPDALEVSLVGAMGRSVRGEDATVVLHEVKVHPEMSTTTIEVTLTRTISGANEPGQDVRMDVQNPQQLEVLDDKGDVLAWFPSGMQGDGDGTRITLTVPSRGTNQATPSRLRYYGMIRSSAEIPFEFDGLKLP